MILGHNLSQIWLVLMMWQILLMSLILLRKLYLRRYPCPHPGLWQKSVLLH